MMEFTAKEVTVFRVATFLNEAFLQIYFLGIYRSSHRRYSVRKGVLKNFAKSTGKHLRQSLFFNKFAGLN